MSRRGLFNDRMQPAVGVVRGGGAAADTFL